MVGKLAVVAIGGNSLIRDPGKPDIESQWGAVHETCGHIAAMIAAGWSVTITHGNGPQVGANMRRFEIAQKFGLYEIPLDLIVAHTQASIGYMLQQALDSALRRLGINRTVVTVVTQTLVDAADEAFGNPEKPVGGFMSEEEALQRQAEGWSVKEDAGRGWRRVVPSPRPLALQETNAIRMLVVNDYRTVVTVVTQTLVDAADEAFGNPEKPVGSFMSEEDALERRAEGWSVKEDAGRGWRRVVPSPRPLALQETNAIRMLVVNDYIVIACGGGGVPVVRDDQGHLRGVRAVIDKDRGGSLLARELRADLFMVSTGVEKVSLNFSRPEQRDLDVLTVAEAERYRDEGHFAVGSMLPKIEACLDFVRNGGPEAIITDPPNLSRALRGETGTRVLPGPV